MAKALRHSLEEKLAALDTAEWDSEDSMSVSSADVVGQEEPTLPSHKQPSKTSKEKKGKNKRSPAAHAGLSSQLSGVIYLGHIPRGFYEEAAKGFFNQFGDVLRLHFGRSKKSGRYKGYAFVEFASAEVAGIVADTMNGYFLCDKQLVCRVLAADEVHPGLFRRTKKFRQIGWHAIRRAEYNADRTREQEDRRLKRLVQTDLKKRAKLAKLGIDYEFPGFEAVIEELGSREAATKQTSAPETLEKTGGAVEASHDKASAPKSKKRKGEASGDAGAMKVVTSDKTASEQGLSKKARKVVQKPPVDEKHPGEAADPVSKGRQARTIMKSPEEGEGASFPKTAEEPETGLAGKRRKQGKRGAKVSKQEVEPRGPQVVVPGREAKQSNQTVGNPSPPADLKEGSKGCDSDGKPEGRVKAPTRAAKKAKAGTDAPLPAQAGAKTKTHAAGAVPATMSSGASEVPKAGDKSKKGNKKARTGDAGEKQRKAEKVGDSKREVGDSKEVATTKGIGKSKKRKDGDHEHHADEELLKRKPSITKAKVGEVAEAASKSASTKSSEPKPSVSAKRVGKGAKEAQKSKPMMTSATAKRMWNVPRSIKRLKAQG